MTNKDKIINYFCRTDSLNALKYFKVDENHIKLHFCIYLITRLIQIEVKYNLATGITVYTHMTHNPGGIKNRKTDTNYPSFEGVSEIGKLFRFHVNRAFNPKIKGESCNWYHDREIWQKS